MKLKKVLASVLSVAMLLSLANIAVFADNAVAKIGNEEYPTLEQAFDSVEDDVPTEIDLMDDYQIVGNAGITITEGKIITFDLNGHTLSNYVNENKASQVITNNGALTITDSAAGGTIKNACDPAAQPGEWWSTPQYNYATNVITNKGTLTIESGTIRQTAAGSICYAIDNNSTTKNTILNINGGVITDDHGTVIRMFCNSTTNENTFNMTDGTVTTNGYAALWIQLPGSNAEAKKATLNISGGALTGASYAFYDYSYGDVFDNVTYDISGGTFNGSIFSYGAKEVNITGGLFKEEVQIKKQDNQKVEISDGYICVEDDTYKTIFNKKDKVTSNTVKAVLYITEEDESGDDVVVVDSIVTVELDDDAVEAVGGTYLQINDVTEELAISDDSKVYDISFVDEIGNTVNFAGTATVKIPYTTAGAVKVFWIDGSNKVDMNATYDGGYVTFTTTHFSTYVIQTEEDITDDITIQYKKIDDNNYDIYAVAESGKLINRLSSAQLEFGIDVTEGNVGYEITPAENISLTGPDADGYYLFNYNGTVSDSDVAAEVKLGTVTFIGYGTFEFATTDEDDKAQVHTAEFSDNIVNNYIVGGGIDTGALIVTGSNNADNDNGDYGELINSTLSPETKDLTINISYNNAINNNAKAYQDMKVVVSGGDLASNIEVDLGSDNDDVTFANDKYTVAIEDTLTENVAYTVTVSGAGYRTARYTVAMTGDKELNFWNNVKDIANATAIETGKTTMTKNFLAGDIVKDNNINIYDLSAVVSYFGTENLVSAHPEYAKYDLNRDGVIDSKDVAYVLVSWGN